MARGIVDIPEKLAGADVGLGVAGGFFVAFAAYILTANAWWFLAAVVGFVAAWRVVMGRWLFLD